MPRKTACTRTFIYILHYTASLWCRFFYTLGQPQLYISSIEHRRSAVLINHELAILSYKSILVWSSQHYKSISLQVVSATAAQHRWQVAEWRKMCDCNSNKLLPESDMAIYFSSSSRQLIVSWEVLTPGSSSELYLGWHYLWSANQKACCICSLMVKQKCPFQRRPCNQQSCWWWYMTVYLMVWLNRWATLVTLQYNCLLKLQGNSTKSISHQYGITLI